MRMNKKFGFTLAEVLITLGIIGVVAAMTIPTLVANTNGKKFSSQFKKSISTLNQAGLMAMAQYDLDYASVGECGTSPATEKAETTSTFCALLNGTLAGQTYVGSAPSGYEWKGGTPADEDAGTAAVAAKLANNAALADMVIYNLADGSMVGFYNKPENCHLNVGEKLSAAVIGGSAGTGKSNLSKCIGFIDVNGTSLPNSEVSCTEGSNSDVATPCTVKNNAANLTDVYPIVFHDSVVEPASAAAKAVLTTSN